MLEISSEEEPIHPRQMTHDGYYDLEEADLEWPKRRGKDRDPNYDEDGLGGSRSYWWHRKLESPIFCGKNPNSLICKAEKYFLFYQLNKKEKLEATTVSFDGESEMWFE